MRFSKEKFFSLFVDPDMLSLRFKLLVYALTFAPEQNPTLIGTCSHLAKYFNVNPSSVAKEMKELEKIGIITKIQNGVWRVNYEVINRSRTKKLEQ